MPSTYAGIIVDPNGESVVVDITTPGGDDITAYTAQDGGTAHTLPLTITTVTAFHIVQRQQVELSLKIDGDENADGDGGTLTVDLRGGGIFTVQAGVSGDGDPESLALERLIRRLGIGAVSTVLEPTGVADTAAITAAAVDAVAAGHNTVQLAAGTFAIDTDMPEWTSGVKLVGAGKGLTNLVLAAGVTYGPRWAGTRTLIGTFTTVAAGARAFTASGSYGASLAAGDWVFLSSGAFFSTRSYYNLGEWNRIKSVVGTAITVEFPLQNAYATADTLNIYKYALLGGALAKSFSVVGSATATQPQHGLRMSYCDLPEIDVHIDGQNMMESGVELYESRAPSGRAHVQRVLDLGRPGATGWLGYGVVNVGCLDAELYVYGEDCRHAYDDSSLSRRPPATNSVIRGVAVNCRAAGFSSHGGSRDLYLDTLSVDCGGGVIQRGYGLSGRVAVRGSAAGETNEYTVLGDTSQSTQHALYLGEPNVSGVASKGGQNIDIRLDVDLLGAPASTYPIYVDTVTVLTNATMRLDRLTNNPKADVISVVTASGTGYKLSRSGIDFTGSSPAWTPEDQGYNAWSADPATLAATGTITSGTVRLVKVRLTKPTISSVTIETLGTPLSAITPGTCWVGLYTIASGTATRIAQVAADTEFAAAIGAKTFTLAATGLTPGGYVYVAVLPNGTGTLSIRTSGGGNNIINSMLTAASGFRACTSGTAQTTLPATIDLSAMTVGANGTGQLLAAGVVA